MLALRTRSSSDNGNDTGPDAEHTLKRMKRGGHNVDPLNPDHIRAYIMLRQQVGRVEGTKLVQFLKNTNSKKETGLGSKTELKYWGVPKQNFSGVPPAHWGDALMGPDQLAMFEPIGDDQVGRPGHPSKGIGMSRSNL